MEVPEGYKLIDGKYVPDINDEDVFAEQESYGVKRENTENGDEGDNNTIKKRKKTQNSAIYVSNLPKDTNEDEIESIFSKYGLIAEDLEGNKRIKLYKNEDGSLKRDGLVVFYRPESVQLAIEMMDDQELRFGDNSNGTVRVEIADSSYKSKSKDQNKEPLKGPPKKEYTKQEKNEMTKKLKQMNNKIAKWDDDELPAKKNTKADKIVVLKHIFTLEELQEDDAAELDIKEDVRDECEKIGPVTSIQLYNLEKDGILTVKFETADQAQACVKIMQSRYFDGRRVEAWIMEPHERFKKSNKFDEDENEEEERVKKFGEWLEKN